MTSWVTYKFLEWFGVDPRKVKVNVLTCCTHPHLGGTSAFLKTQNPNIQIVGLQPEDGASIPGIRRWPAAYMPGIFDAAKVDQLMDISQVDAENAMRRLAREEGIFCGVSAGGSVAAALKLSEQVENATIVAVICDRGDRYLSSGVYR